MHAHDGTDRTEAMPPVTDDGPFPIGAPVPCRHSVPLYQRLAAGWFWVCVYVTLGVWTWALIVAARVLKHWW